MKYCIRIRSITFILFFLFFGCSINESIYDKESESIENNHNTDIEDGWIKDDENWYYYENGKILKNQIADINGTLYFFYPDGRMLINNEAKLEGYDFRAKQNGALYRNEWYKSIDANYYYYNNSAIKVKNAWNETYYLLEDGRMAYNQYVDRFYIDSNGTWKTNNFTEESWLVEGNWIRENNLYYYISTSGEKQLIDLSKIRSINRLGYNTVSPNGLPQQSIIAYEEALKHGFSILLCDLQFTADNIPVCFHDPYINMKARNRDGTIIENEKIFIKDCTFEKLATYDYGIYKGSLYKDTEILTLQKMLEFCDNHSVLELYIEVKDGDKQQLEQTIDMVKSYNIDISWACTTYEQAQNIVNYDPYARISLMPYNINEELQNILSLKTGYNDVFIFAYGNAILNADIVNVLKMHNIAFEMGTIDSEEEIIRYWNGFYYYCSGIESNTISTPNIDLYKCIESLK